jgi:hypothetical protein
MDTNRRTVTTSRPTVANNATKVANAAIMYGTGSAQHLAVIKRFGSK